MTPRRAPKAMEISTHKYGDKAKLVQAVAAIKAQNASSEPTERSNSAAINSTPMLIVTIASSEPSFSIV